MTQLLRVFLCHASQDKAAVTELYNALNAEDWIDPWLDKAKILPGQDWRMVIEQAVEDSDVVIVCLSNQSISKEGFVQKEIRYAYDIAQEKPAGSLFLIPLRLEECSLPRGLGTLQWVDYFGSEKRHSYERLLEAFKLRFYQRTKQEETKSNKEEYPVSNEKNIGQVAAANPVNSTDAGLEPYLLIEIGMQQAAKDTYPFWIGKYPVTNAQYERFINSPDFSYPVYWLEYPKYDEDCRQIGDWGQQGYDWLQEELQKGKSTVLLPRYWDHKDFGVSNPNCPVIGISWYEASAYCEWLFQNWDICSESKANPSLNPRVIRLPLESEWVMAAGEDEPTGRYPWDESGQITTSLKEILRRANINESRIGHTTPVNKYALGKSPFGVMDMIGNAWEWQANYYDATQEFLCLRGGSWLDNSSTARIAFRYGLHPAGNWRLNFGFRVAVLSSKISNGINM